MTFAFCKKTQLLADILLEIKRLLQHHLLLSARLIFVSVVGTSIFCHSAVTGGLRLMLAITTPRPNIFMINVNYTTILQQITIKSTIRLSLEAIITRPYCILSSYTSVLPSTNLFLTFQIIANYAGAYLTSC